MEEFDEFEDLFLDEEYYRPPVLHPLYCPRVRNPLADIIPLIGATVVTLMDSREHQPRQEGLAEVLEAKSDIDFFRHLRLSRNSFARTLEIIYKAYDESSSGTTLYLGPRKSLYLTLCYLSTQSTYCEISELFGVSQMTVFECVQRVIDVLCAAGKKVIVWPTAEEQHQVSIEFLMLGGIPEVIGAVDGCHIHIKAPSDTQADYINQNQRHTVNLMAVCTADKKFSFIQAGFPGSAHDSCVFRSCTVFTKMQNSDATFFSSPNYHIVGDSAFPLHKHLMVPLKNIGNQCEAQSKFNTKLSKARVTIENAFDFLKGRFRHLKYVDADIERIPKIVKACCVLHNIALQHPEDIIFLEREGVLNCPMQVSGAKLSQTQQVEEREKQWLLQGYCKECREFHKHIMLTTVA
ncbi:putative nuclease HARBI1 [Portunus trituberculatus]|uniref:putative nuclease HARBI1 n=1 Tax=Portunus trituberculatus TaxID=210409 RepID=UPI001E1CEA0D|nr:putative nuclease HARBI1 [Portunus trituberculatus]